MMLHRIKDDGAWFAPKRFGYGAGWPIAWQGWLVLAAYVAAMAGAALLASNGHGKGGRAAGFALMLMLTGLFMVIAARRTRGGWKWRRGGEE